MPRIKNHKSHSVGLPPGTLIHFGEKKSESCKITLYEYNESHFEKKEHACLADIFTTQEPTGIKWINVDGIHEVELLEKIGKHFGIHSLVLEDILNTTERPKVEDYGEYLYFVLRMVQYNEFKKEIETEQVSIILGRNFVLSFQEQDGDVFNPVRGRLNTPESKIRRLGADYLAYALLDSIVDHYFLVMEKIGDWIEELEEELEYRLTKETIHKIHHLRRELLYIRKSVWPLRDILSSLERGNGESPLIKESTEIYLRDVFDHIIRMIDTVETYREILAGMHDIYLSGISNRMNEIMKVLTIISTFFIPLTFISGLYGMNFSNMPELSWPWGYPAVLAIMGVVSIIMYNYFKRKKWF